MGDKDGKMREALRNFPIPEVAERILESYFVPGGKSENAPFKSKSLPAIEPNRMALDLLVAANFCEVFLAKQGHNGVVGVNLLEKIQLPTMPSLFGAMLAGVDYVLMGAGIPRAIPAILDSLSNFAPTELKLDVAGAGSGQEFVTRFNPAPYRPQDRQTLQRPFFIAIISSSTLALTLARKCSSHVDGFVVEAPTAGGHNAPPRGSWGLDELGQPVYGARDIPDLEQIRELGLPFWLAGGRASAERLQDAINFGASGIQVGTAFAFCDESGIDPAIKKRVLEESKRGSLKVFTDPLASPTGYPFKVLELTNTLSDRQVYEERDRLCDLGYLREAYAKEDGSVGFRCPGEPVDDYVRKGGDSTATIGRKCVCNGLLATVEMPQIRKQGFCEPPLVTSGDAILKIAEFLTPGHETYSATDVVNRLLS